MKTTETTATRALVPYVSAGQPHDDLTPDIQGAGVDTVYFSFDVTLSDAMWEQLEDEQAIAKASDTATKAQHCPDWLGARMCPTGAKGGYHFLIETPNFSIKLLKGTPNRPPIYVEMRAFGLHTDPEGEMAACEQACAYIRTVLLADKDQDWAAAAITLDTARCSRLDLYLDWQGGWYPAFEADDERHFIKRVHANVERYSADGAVTSYHIGTGDVQARIYNKTVEMTKTHNEWYPALLAARNAALYDPSRALWRLEFQLLRAGVKGFKLVAKPEVDDPDDMIQRELDAEDLPHIHSVRKAFHWAGRIWAYLTKRWLRLTTPTTDPNRGRWPEHPTWAALRQGFDRAMQGGPLPPDTLDLVRAKRHTGYQRLLNRMAVGVLTALEAEDTDPGAALVAYTAFLARLATAVRQRQEQRMAAWDARRAEGLGQGYERDDEHPNERPRKRRLGMRPNAFKPNLRRGQGARMDSLKRAQKREDLLHMALGVFTSAGIVDLRLPEQGALTSVGDLLLYSLDELEAIADEKGGILPLLDAKWQQLYKAASPRGLFTRGEVHVA